MDSSFNQIEENIRPPDEVKREQLIEHNMSDFEKEIDKALNLSAEEFRKQQEYYDKYEEQLINEYGNSCKKKREIFENFLLDLNRLIKYDKEIKEIFNIIEPIIESYCNEYIQYINLDGITYHKIFDTLNKTRVNKDTLEILKNIILRE
jgi:hypothetical protein